MNRVRWTMAAAVMCAAMLFLRIGGAAASRPVQALQAPQAPQALQAPQPAQASDYVGSVVCARCHEAPNDNWEHSLHLQMTRPVADARVLGDFSKGTRFSDHGRSYEFGLNNGKPYVRVAFGDRAPETFPVDYTLGFKRYQGYLSTLPDGRIYVLPSFWHVATKRWLDWQDLAPVPDGAHDVRQIWNVNCFNCHATNLTQGYDIAARKYRTQWTEMGIGCEACHGPGAQHVSLIDPWFKNPSLVPPYDESAKEHSPTATLKIFAPRGATPRQIFDTCAYCHGNKTNVFVGFTPGDRYEDYALPFLLSESIPVNDLQGEFWPDGRPNRFNRPQAVMQSGCFLSGQLTCTSCHVAHGSGNPFSLKVDVTQGTNGDRLCTQCHATPRAGAFSGAGLDKHTFHKPDSPGSRCINCHMSDVNWRLLIRRRDHTYRPPVPELTASFGIPNACTTCHDHRTPEWAARQMDAWWGDGTRRKAALSLADTMYRAGSRDSSVVPALARLAIDRTAPPFIRASAADYLGKFLTELRVGEARERRPVQSQTSFGDAQPAAPSKAMAPFTITPALVNALVGAAADPEPIVRAAAVRALAASGDEARVTAPLTARLIDQARVVRVRAAEALFGLGVVQLPGNAGAALTRAQGELIDSLQSFPDMASNHAAVAWLDAQIGKVAEALAAADNALRLQPRYARPWVIKGVIAARTGKYAEAIESWKKARDIEPSYPNIDKLIGEAERLRGSK